MKAEEIAEILVQAHRGGFEIKHWSREARVLAAAVKAFEVGRAEVDVPTPGWEPSQPMGQNGLLGSRVKKP